MINTFIYLVVYCISLVYFPSMCIFTNLDCFPADTLPRFNTVVPTVTVQPPSVNKTKPVPDNNRDSADKKQEQPIVIERKQEQPIVIERQEKVQSSPPKPKLVEMARQSSKEVYKYEEVVQKQTVLESERPIVAEARHEVMSAMKPVEVVAPLPEAKHKGSRENQSQIRSSYSSHTSVVSSPCLLNKTTQGSYTS